jgi:uncharacterized membrane protein YhiD involved in acid resistance
MDALGKLFAGAKPTDPLRTVEVVVAIALAFALTVVIAAVYRHTHRGTFYTQDYVHTLILLGMVVTAVIMVVGRSVERAFAVFAALSIIRFRRSVPETRDIGFIFFAMAVGLACGAQQYELALVATIVISLAVLVISRLNLFAPARATHLVRLRLHNGLDFEQHLREPFARLFDRVELRAVESAQAKTMTELRYAVTLRQGITQREVTSSLGSHEGVDRVLLLEPVPERDY